MTTAKHTPGPWERPAPCVVTGPDGHGVATILSFVGPVKTRTEKEAVANARLIAAAPDLLAALVDLVNFQKGREDWPEIRRAEAAIRKATEELQ